VIAEAGNSGRVGLRCPMGTFNDVDDRQPLETFS